MSLGFCGGESDYWSMADEISPEEIDRQKKRHEFLLNVEATVDAILEAEHVRWRGRGKTEPSNVRRGWEPGIYNLRIQFHHEMVAAHKSVANPPLDWVKAWKERGVLAQFVESTRTVSVWYYHTSEQGEEIYSEIGGYTISE